jgi:hypothetical protein
MYQEIIDSPIIKTYLGAIMYGSYIGVSVGIMHVGIIKIHKSLFKNAKARQA